MISSYEMDSSNIDFEKMVDAWLAGRRAGAGDSKWADDLLFEWTFANEPENLWRFVCAAYTRDMPMEDFAVLAAGPLEDLLANFGPDYIDRVEELARRDSKFGDLLGGVWKNTMTEEVWHRVQKARTQVW